YTREGYQLFYEAKGKGLPILFIHGYLGSSRSHWGPQLDDEELFSRYHLIAPDLRGFAKSSKGKFVETNRTDDIIEDIHFLIKDTLKLTSKPVLIGYSVGATLGILYHLKYPDSVSGLVLVSPRPFIHKTTRAWNFLAKDKRSGEEKRSTSSLTWSIVKRLQKIVSYFATYIQKRRSKEYLEELKKITIPVLILHGTEDTVNPQIVFSVLKNNLPNHSEIHILEGDHGIAHEHTAEFNRILRNFLSSC
ncbi:MAG: alpha/beta fold hydrolase, partial [Candidatus Hodarchaeales archaeon]